MVYYNMNEKSNTQEYPKKMFRSIAKLDSRVFYLRQIEADWDEIILNLSEGIRNRKSVEQLLVKQNRDFQNEYNGKLEKLKEESGVVNILEGEVVVLNPIL